MVNVKPRKAVENLQGYRPPREGRVGKLRLDFNENTVGCAPAVVRALRKALNRDWLSTYPDLFLQRAEVGPVRIFVFTRYTP